LPQEEGLVLVSYCVKHFTIDPGKGVNHQQAIESSHQTKKYKKLYPVIITEKSIKTI